MFCSIQWKPLLVCVIRPTHPFKPMQMCAGVRCVLSARRHSSYVLVVEIRCKFTGTQRTSVRMWWFFSVELLSFSLRYDCFMDERRSDAFYASKYKRISRPHDISRFHSVVSVEASAADNICFAWSQLEAARGIQYNVSGFIQVAMPNRQPKQRAYEKWKHPSHTWTSPIAADSSHSHTHRHSRITVLISLFSGNGICGCVERFLEKI